MGSPHRNDHNSRECNQCHKVKGRWDFSLLNEEDPLDHRRHAVCTICQRKRSRPSEDHGRTLSAMHTSLSRARKLGGYVRWVTRAELYEIYATARRLSAQKGKLMVVDHIVPLGVHHGVCGLHVPWNLRIIEQGQNVRKGPRLGEQDAPRFRTKTGLNRFLSDYEPDQGIGRLITGHTRY